MELDLFINFFLVFSVYFWVFFYSLSLFGIMSPFYPNLSFTLNELIVKTFYESFVGSRAGPKTKIVTLSFHYRYIIITFSLHYHYPSFIKSVCSWMVSILVLCSQSTGFKSGQIIYPVKWPWFKETKVLVFTCQRSV